jgi:adhesin/invasin
MQMVTSSRTIPFVEEQTMYSPSTALIRRSFRQTAAVALIALAGACNSTKDVNSPAKVATSLTASAGISGQSAAVGLTTPTAISVIVLDENGATIAGAPVTWGVLTGGGTVNSASSTTDANGVATITWTLGTKAGANTLQASLASGTSVTITATGVAGPATALSIASGNNQTVSLGSTSAAFSLMATDAYGNPVSGLAVSWGTSAGTLSAATSTTDVNGLTSVTLVTDSITPNYLITATSGNLSANFSLTAQ